MSVPPFGLDGATVRLSLPLVVCDDVVAGTQGELRVQLRDESGESWPVALLLSVVPGSYALHPGFPNPFNPQTTLRFDLPTGGVVSLRVYSLAGQLVKTLVNGTRNAGVH